MHRFARTGVFAYLSFAAAALSFSGLAAAQVSGLDNQPGDPLGGVGIDGTATEGEAFKIAEAGPFIRDVARLPSGDFLVLYVPAAGGTLLIQRHDNRGADLGDPITVTEQPDSAFFYATGGRLVVAANGRFAAAWQQGPFSTPDIYTRLFDADGTPISSAQQANSYTDNAQSSPGIAIGPDGDYVVVWQSVGQDGDVEVDEVGNMTLRRNIYGQRFDASGNTSGGEFLVNTTTGGDQVDPDVGMDIEGNFVVAFLSSGVRYRRFQADGTPLGDESDSILTSNDEGAGSNTPAITVAANGTFAIGWFNAGSGEVEISTPQLRRFDADGEPIDDQSLSLGNYFEQGKEGLDLSSNYEGDVIAVWSSFGQKTAEENDFVLSVYGRLVQIDDTEPTGDQEFPVSDESLAGDQEFPSVSMDADGDFVVTWRSSETTVDDDGNMPNDGLFAQRYVGPEPVDLSASLTAVPNPVEPNGNLTYTVTATNTHDPVAPTGVDAIDSAIGIAAGLNASIALPDGAVAGSVDSDDWICPDAGSGTSVVCNFQGTLAAGADSSFELPTAAPPSEGDASATLTVASSQFDPDAGDDDSNNVDQLSVTVATDNGDDGGGDNGNAGDEDAGGDMGGADNGGDDNGDDMSGGDTGGDDNGDMGDDGAGGSNNGDMGDMGGNGNGGDDSGGDAGGGDNGDMGDDGGAGGDTGGDDNGGDNGNDDDGEENPTDDGDFDGVADGNGDLPVQGQSNFDGGCTIGDGGGPFDPLFPALMFAAGLVMIRRRPFRSRNSDERV